MSEQNKKESKSESSLEKPQEKYGKDYHYQIFGVDPHCDMETIHEAFSKLKAQYEVSGQILEENQEYIDLQNAYEILSSPIGRKIYDSFSSQAEKFFEHESLAAEGNAEAQNMLGRCYEWGIGVCRNLDQAFHYYDLSTQQGCAEGQLLLGKYYLNYCSDPATGASQEAVVLFQLSADQGNPDAQYQLGVLYEYGTGVEQNAEEAIRLYRLSAEKGEPNAQCSLGLYYLDETNGSKDIGEGIKWLMMSEKQGITRGCLELQKITSKLEAKDWYDLAVTFAERGDDETAFTFYLMAANKGNPVAKYKLGLCYEKGIGVEQNEREAIEHYQLLVKKWLGMLDSDGESMYQQKAWLLLQEEADAETQCKFASIFAKQKTSFTAPTMEIALSLYQLSAKKGNPTASYELGKYYESEIFGKKDQKKALELYQSSADKGNADACYKLGLFYEKGIAVPADVKEAFRNYKRSADLGSTAAHYNLGVCYEEGNGVKKDAKEAIKYYRLSAERGEVSGQYRLGLCYFNGVGVTKNIVEAIRLFKLLSRKLGNIEARYKLEEARSSLEHLDVEEQLKLAIIFRQQGDEDTASLLDLFAKRDDPSAEYELGKKFEEGVVVSDHKKAFKLYESSANKGNADAYYQLGVCYEQGRVVEADKKEAFRNYQISAECGNIRAYYQMGVCYENGIGVGKNEEEAFKNYQISAKGGNADAWLQVGVCYENGKGVEKNERMALKAYKISIGFGNIWARSKLEEMQPEYVNYMNRCRTFLSQVSSFPNSSPETNPFQKEHKHFEGEQKSHQGTTASCEIFKFFPASPDSDLLKQACTSRSEAERILRDKKLVTKLFEDEKSKSNGKSEHEIATGILLKMAYSSSETAEYVLTYYQHVFNKNRDSRQYLLDLAKHNEDTAMIILEIYRFNRKELLGIKEHHSNVAEIEFRCEQLLKRQQSRPTLS